MRAMKLGAGHDQTMWSNLDVLEPYKTRRVHLSSSLPLEFHLNSKNQSELGLRQY
jgi:hypothetical protein